MQNPQSMSPGPGRLRRGRGGVYIAVLGASLLVTILGVAALAATALERLTVQGASEMAKARAAAESGIDLALLDIKNTPTWRTSRVNGTWFSNRPVGDATVTVEATDPNDGVLSNNPADPLVLKATGVRGNARHITEVRLAAQTTPMDVLRTALHAAGQVHVRSGKVVTATGGPVSSNLTIRNEGTITGNVETPAMTGSGTVSGTVLMPAPPKAMPGTGPVNLYASWGTAISPPTTIDKQVLGPGVNPWGPTNADGLYVITTASNTTIKNSRIYGTLVIRCPGKTVTLDNALLMHPVRADYPTLIIDGNLDIRIDGGAAVLNEDPLDVSFNPPGAPYQGSTDTDELDTYPSELQGLIHVTGTVKFSSAARIRGTLICESGALTDAMDIGHDPQIIYDPNLFTTPPTGYMTTSGMAIVPGSWKQLTLP